MLKRYKILFILNLHLKFYCDGLILEFLNTIIQEWHVVISMAIRSRFIGLAAVFAAMTTAATIMIQVYIPATQGYFNFGEVMVYISALLLGPRLGFITCGFGSALADVITGFHMYAPGTFIIKGTEGFIVGYLSRYLRNKVRKSRSGFTIAIPILLFLMTLIVGSFLYVGLVEVTLGYGSFSNVVAFSMDIRYWAAISIAVLLVFIWLTCASRNRVTASLSALSCLTGGLAMVTGYLLYEYFVLSFGTAALIEVPYNIGQMIIGVIVAVPISMRLEEKIRSLVP
ncbi:MAG: hypothetical protein B6U94_08265 [Thermofilum sp. ex4484_79]|nr:MAG: hypothetical protein B6U94_08265 [Thermofilum sp. ex4484_79]